MEALQSISWKVQHIPLKVKPIDSNVVSRLIHAALIDKEFEHLLLSDPLAALMNGYNGEHFAMDEEELAFILSIHADSLADFANQWIDHKQ
jgi:hypothetical protein